MHACLGLAYITVTPPVVRKERYTLFIVGQPLGYYSSWPLFTLSHHMIVWMAAERVYPGAERFKAYAILGDDVVIGDTRVAAEYKSILTELQVSIS